MNKNIIIASIVLILMVLAGGAYLFFSRQQTSPISAPSAPTYFPTASTSPVSTGGNAPSILTSAGTSLTTRDFIHNGITVQDTQNEGSYVLAGSLGYCLSNGTCGTGTQKGYSIFYNDQDKSFTIALLTEPLGQTRKDAEAYLQSSLGITSTQMCSLNYYLGTSYTINESYTGRNLGFSFCPGAVTLP